MTTAAPASAGHDQPKTVSLNVLDDAAQHREPARPRSSSIARWRAAAMIAVYVIITAHVIQWRMTGHTIAPAVISDSMYTLEMGELNTGFIFGALALLVTLVVGRFLCGWACHMGGLQDLCAWLLRKMGVPPRMFRARLLGYLPLALALYMFVWPTFKREALAPALRALWPTALAYVGDSPAFPGLTTRLTTDDLWAHLPTVAVAIPFLLVCGFATVYFLGGRGLCRYVCPYGGFFSPLEQLAPGRVVVDPNRCDACGICTSTCTSGVRVHEEVAAYGMVVNRNCVKTLDCIGACPQRALKFRFTRPALLKPRPRAQRPKALYDLTWGEELLVGGAFTGTFFITRGLYDLIPMLMAVGMGVCVAFIVWKVWRLVRDRNSTFARAQLKLRDRLRPAGWSFAAVAALMIGLLVHSALVRYWFWRGGAIDGQVAVSREAVFSGHRAQVPAETVAAAGAALDYYTRGSGWAHGGWGFADTPQIDMRAAWLRLVRAEYPQAEDLLRRAMERSGPGDPACADLARVMLLQGRPDRSIEYLHGLADQHPDFAQCRDLLAWLYAQTGQGDKALAVYRAAVKQRPDDVRARAGLASLLLSQGSVAEAIDQLRQASAAAPQDAGVLGDLAVATFLSGDVSGATATLERAVQLDPRAGPAYYRRGAEMLAAAGRAGEAQAWLARAEVKDAGKK